ncbi:hypothetical protein GW17_00040349, partial [Ensete ventricosum]
SRVSIDFSCIVSKIQNTGHSQHNSPSEVIQARFHEKKRWSETLRKVMRKVEFRSVFYAPRRKFKILAIPNILAHAQKFKILAIPNVLAHGKLYKHSRS